MFKKSVLAVLVLCMAFGFFSCTKKMTKEEMEERGKYLVTACGVLWYHTPIDKEGKPVTDKFMGGSDIGFEGPWGVYYPSNLTPDDTGINQKTDSDVVKMIKEECSNGEDGKGPMFYNYYSKLTDDDLNCIVLYLRKLSPVKNQVPMDLKPGEPVKTAVIKLNVVGMTASAPAAKTTKKPAPKKPVKKK